MKDGIIKGEGNSRLLRAPASIPATYAEFRSALIAGTLPVDLLYNALGWDVEGTPLNKANLLTDAVAAALGLTSDDPTVNEAINALLAVATSVRNGLMSASDKIKLDGVASNANNYVHPTTAGNKHIPSGGASNQILKYSASGTAVWGTPEASNTGLSSTLQDYYGTLDTVEDALKNYVHKDTVVVISASGNWTPLRANMLIDVFIMGAGAGGGNGGGGAYFGGGGGGGYARYLRDYKISSATPIAVTIGAGGAANTDGGNTSFGTISVKGGSKGATGSADATGGAGGAGGGGGSGATSGTGGAGANGHGGNGSVSSTGKAGGIGEQYESSLGGYCSLNSTLYGGAGGGAGGTSGAGGAGGGGAGASSSASAGNGTLYGAGGGGGSQAYPTAGSGYQGVVIIGYNS